MFNYIEFFQDYGIEYWTEGKNVPDGGCNTECPHCDDKSNHMMWNPTSTYCWKCGSHRLFDTINEMTNRDAKETIKILKKYNTSDDFEVGESSHSKKIEYKNTTICVPGSKLKKGHKKYLTKRGLDATYLEKKYDLRGTLATDDCFAYRIIIPVYYNRRIVSYLGRDFTNKQELRYITCFPEKEIIPHKSILYNLDNCKLRRAIVVEGTVDAMNVGDNCCATFGIKYRPEQLRLLRERFDEIYVMYDGEPQAQAQAHLLCREFGLLGGKATNICLDDGDPGEMTDEDKSVLKKDLNL